MMDTKSIDEIANEVNVIAKRYPHMRVYVLIGQPCAEHAGEHLDLASCGDSGLTTLVDAAITSLAGTVDKRVLQ